MNEKKESAIDIDSLMLLYEKPTIEHLFWSNVFSLGAVLSTICVVQLFTMGAIGLALMQIFITCGHCALAYSSFKDYHENSIRWALSIASKFNDNRMLVGSNEASLDRQNDELDELIKKIEAVGNDEI